MFDAGGFREIAESMRRHKTRTALTGFSIFWAILTLMVLLGTGSGIRHGVERMYSSDNQSSIWIFARKTSEAHKGYSPGRRIFLSERDLAAVRRDIPDVEYASAENPMYLFTKGTTLISHGNRTVSIGVFGVADDYFKIKLNQTYVQGRRLNALDAMARRKVVAIGTRAAALVLPDVKNPIGQFIGINGIPFQIVGLFDDPGEEGSFSERIYMPLAVFQNTFGNNDDIVLLVVTPKPGRSSFTLEQQVVDLLKDRHDIARSDQKAIFSNNLAKQAEQVGNVFSAINIFVWLVGIGTLISGAVGISNIMLISIKERTREIGIRKAIGATPRSVLVLVLAESIVVTTVAGYAGLVLGAFVLEGMNWLALNVLDKQVLFARPEVDLGVALSTLLALIVAGLLAGLWPALRAARVNPIEAMRA
jgi:putative ABC transport system permease protein